MTTTFASQRMVVIGVGLIGGSLIKALRKKSVVGEVVGVGRSIESLERAKALGVIDSYKQDAQRAVSGADLVILATPVQSMASVFAEIAPAIDDHCTISDVGSVKGSVVALAKQHLGARFPQFVAAHPIAGIERSGVEAAFAELFEQHRVIITPSGEEQSTAIERITAMWQLVGSKIDTMSVSEHDRVLSVTSHLPHMVAYALVNYLGAQLQANDYQYAAGGFYDISRVASSDPIMWRDIALANQLPLTLQMRELAEALNAMAAQIEHNDAQQLEKAFSEAQQLRGEIGEYRSHRLEADG